MADAKTGNINTSVCYSLILVTFGVLEVILLYDYDLAEGDPISAAVSRSITSSIEIRHGMETGDCCLIIIIARTVSPPDGADKLIA